MPNQRWAQSLVEAQADGPTLSNSGSETNILPTAAIWTLPAGFLLVGSKLRLTFGGRYSNVATTPTLRFILRYGAVSTGVILFDTTALTTQPAPVTNVTFRVRADITVRSIGSGTGATAMAIGEQLGITSATAPGLVPATAPAVTAGFDSTLATALNLSAIWGTAAAGNTLTLHEYMLESLN